MTTKTAGAQALAVLPRNEKALQTQVLKWLNEQGGFFENRSPGQFGSTGVPDITGVYLGRFVAIELKHPREHGPQNIDTRWPAQKRYLQKVYEGGGFALGTNNLAAVVKCIHSIRAEMYYGISTVIASYTEDWA